MAREPQEDPRASQYARRMDTESSVSYMGCLFSILSDAEETDGRFGLMEMVVPRGREPSRHLHHSDDEGFYVLDGRVTFYVGEKTYVAGPGTFVFLPHGVPHSYAFETDVVRMLSLIAPGGLEAHFQDSRFSEPARDLTLPAPGGLDQDLLEEMARDLADYGTEVVGPPGPPQR
jgi:quercetin dioxygenase-like cupin family protein